MFPLPYTGKKSDSTGVFVGKVVGQELLVVLALEIFPDRCGVQITVPEFVVGEAVVVSAGKVKHHLIAQVAVDAMPRRVERIRRVARRRQRGRNKGDRIVVIDKPYNRKAPVRHDG